MVSLKGRFLCQACGAVFSKWLGQCDVCKEWNSVVEETVGETEINDLTTVPENFFTRLDVSTTQFIASRHKTNISELDRVLGGGLVDSSVILLGGAPGIGKSTLLLQIVSDIPSINEFIYLSAEESIGQVLMRARRLGISNPKLKVASTTNLNQIFNALNTIQPNSLVIIDSIQTVFSEAIQSPPGSVSQVRYCTVELVNFAKSHNVIVIIVGHVTKDGTIAGPKTLEHMVDCVLSFEGDRTCDYRILRGEKNRYGPIDEIGVFSMTNTGLKEVSNPSAAFLSDRNSKISGIAVFSGIEGTRPILSEIQALVSVTGLQIPRRTAIGFDINRLSMIVAVLSKRCRLQFSNKDIYVNIAGGLRINEPAADLAVAAAIISSTFNTPMPVNSVFFGEIGLSGEVRQSYLAFSRLKEASKLGYCNAYASIPGDISELNIKVCQIKFVKELLEIVRSKHQSNSEAAS